MNEHILKVMRHLDNPKSLNEKEMVANNSAAFEVAFGKDSTSSGEAVTCAAHAARNILTPNQKYAAKYWVKEFFSRTMEDRQPYIDEVERLR